MLEKYRHYIYKNKEDIDKCYEYCLNYVLKLHPHARLSDILHSVNSNAQDMLNYDYTSALAMYEGKKLFDITAKKYGYDIWNGTAWVDKNCHKNCPFGMICKKHLIQIDEKYYCYGQLYNNSISENKVIELSMNHLVRLLTTDKETILNLNNNSYDIQILSEFFFNYKYFLMWFGDYECTTEKVNGHNVICVL